MKENIRNRILADGEPWFNYNEYQAYKEWLNERKIALAKYLYKNKLNKT